MRITTVSLATLIASLATGAVIAAEQAVIHTNRGDITVELFAEQAPGTVANFVEYARSGFYDGTVFHRVIPRFMIQGGGFTAELHEKPTRGPIENESKNRLNNDRWTIAMARTSDPDSATSQFFINLRMNFDLDYRAGKPGYAVFGKVVDGQHVARDISLVDTTSVAGLDDVPVEPVVIESVEIVE